MTAKLGEITSLQTPLIKGLVDAGWTHIHGPDLARTDDAPWVEAEVVAALVRLNPVIAEEPERAQEVLQHLRAISIGAVDSGLVEANRDLSAWLRGLRTHQFLGTDDPVIVRLIDFDHPSNNRLVVSDEVSFGVPGHKARFDLVLWVNGFPLAVGELKTPTNQKVSWLTGAVELVDVYQPGWPQFFTANTVVFASEGKSLRYAGVGAPVDQWHTWGPELDTPSLANVIGKAQSLLAPETLLDLLGDFTLFETPDSNEGASLHKIVARYTQYEAVQLIVDRVHHPERSKGLIYHTQGSGKTLAMVFAAGKLLRDPAMNNPTIILVADRVQLVAQMWDQFRTTSMPRLVVPETSGDLRQALARDQRGIIFTTVHKFAGAPLLNERSNIVVLVDEAHRTQEGDLGIAMRAALPNANLFAFTGTPIVKLKRNTFATFGDDADPAKTLHTYSSEDSIRDGMTVPIHVAPRKVEFNLATADLDQAFAALAEAEGLDESEQEYLASRAARTATFFSNPERVAAVCADIVDHFYDTVDPLGMKAQVVVVDRTACVAYVETLDQLLHDRYQRALAKWEEQGDRLVEAPVRDEVAVVMTVGTSKDEPDEWAKYALSEAEELALLKRFRTHQDPLKFLVCTSKLGTGFDAPIEGVMYLDKPLKEHTLFQTITRTNRNWRNPDTKQSKRYGIIVDYVGLGSGFARAMAPADGDQPTAEIDIAGLLAAFEAQLADTMKRFAGIDTTKADAATLIDAQARMPGPQAQDDFAGEFTMLEGIWEAIHPHESLQPHRRAYRFLAAVYSSLQPSGGMNELLWHQLGAKTLRLVHDHMSDITVTKAKTVVIADAEAAQKLIDEGLIDSEKALEGKTAADVIDSIANRLKKKLAGPNGDHPVYKSLAERLERLRERTLTAAQQSIDWLREAFQLAGDVTEAEKAEREAGRDGLDLLPDPRVGALTQIFYETAPDGTPELIERVVLDIDAIVRRVSYDGWAVSNEGDRLVRRNVRAVLRKHGMHQVEGLFEDAYDYISKNY